MQPNSLQCTVCKNWIHKRCSGLRGDLLWTIQEADLAEDLMVDGETYGCVNNFCYLGDTLDGDGGADLAATARTGNGWMDVPRAFAISDIRSSRLRWYGHVMRKGDEDWVKKCMEYRVEGRRLVGRPRKTWLESVEADMTELEIDKEDVHDRKKWKRNVMKRKSNPIGKRTINR